MFTFNTAVDTYTKGAKEFLNVVPNETLRTELVKLTEAHAAFTKSVANTSLDMAKEFANKYVKFSFTK
jgi:hypothetical protein